MPPSAPESLRLALPSLGMHVLHWPADPGGPTFLLLHGLASNARFWELVAPFLAEAGHPVWAPDLRGHGQSDKPDEGYDFTTLVSDVGSLIQAIGLERPIVAGHSWGGMVALEYAGRVPEGRLSPRSLALVDGGIGQVNDYPGATREATLAALTPPRLAGTRLEDFIARLETPPRAFPIDEVRRDIILANFNLRPDGTIAPNLSFDHHMELAAGMWDSPVYRWFEAVRCPVLMVPARGGDVRGVRHEVYRGLKERGAARASQTIRHLRVAWMDDTDHDIPLHRPEALARLLLDLAEWVPE